MNTPALSLLSVSRTARSVLVISAILIGAQMSRATTPLLYMPGGSSTQYNGHFAQEYPDGFYSVVGATFDLPVATQIDGVRGWISGDQAAFGIAPYPVTNPDGAGFSRAFNIEVVTKAPAKWQGVQSLNWVLQPGTYKIFLSANDIPYGYGGTEPYLKPLYDLYNVLDYSTGSEPPYYVAPFGIQVYGRPLSAVPESSTYGLLGAAGLGMASVARALKRKRQFPSRP